MEASILPLIALILGIALGGAVGWLLASRPIADLRARLAEAEANAAKREAELKSAIKDLYEQGTQVAALGERAARADELEVRYNSSQTQRAELAERIAALESTATAREKALEDRYAERETQFARELTRLQEAEDKLQAKFGEIGEKMLEGARSKFLEGAQSHLANLNKESLAELEKKVGPVGETLERYRLQVAELEKNRVSDFERLRGVIGQVQEGQQRVIDGANRITTTLQGATKARGDWGELQLENLLEACGLYDKTDFNFQTSVRDEDGNVLRPDAVLNIPGGRRLIVDVKNVFNTYRSANEAETEEERQTLLRAHARELRTHIDALSAKRYQDYVDGSADFVVMFVPGEHVLYAALTQDSGLLDYALKRQVVLSSPLNFMSIALTVSTVWRQAGFQANAQEIARLGKELYDRLGVVAGHLGALRKSLSSTNQHFDKLVGSFDTNLRRTGERFEQLNVDTSAQELVEALPIGHTPRALMNFSEAGETDGEGNRTSNTAE